ncbi:MAG: response regulator [Candidatus Acidoferrales bacterium]|nr:response regulator [Candidatus Acidoferrales bacterium]
MFLSATTVRTLPIATSTRNRSDAELTLHALRKSKLANQIQLARDGEEALDFLFCRGAFSTRRFERGPRLILFDLKLPKVDGLQVLEQVKADSRTKAIPIIVLTSSKEERDLVKSYKLGVNSYIQKPVHFGEFQKVVEQLGMYWLLVNSNPPAAAFLAQ